MASSRLNSGNLTVATEKFRKKNNEIYVWEVDKLISLSISEQTGFSFFVLKIIHLKIDI